VPRYFPLQFPASAQGSNPEYFSIRFYGNDAGNGITQIDRLTTLANEVSHTANIGSTDTTHEGWIRCAAGNNSSGMTVGANYNAIEGNIFLDRDRFGLTRSYVMSLDAGRIVFGLNMGSDITIRGTTDIRDDLWHHWALTRDESTGALVLYIDGTSEASGTGARGDISCPNTGGGATWDPYLVLGAEKHDADVAIYPSFYGWQTELRLSNTIRYVGNFTRPSAPFVVDGNTMSLWHFNEGAGTTAVDEAGNNDFTFQLGGAANGPTWDTSSPF